MRLLDNIEAKADAKGKAFLPAVLRKVLNALSEEPLILRKDIFESCLVLYPESMWDKRVDTLRKRLSRRSRRDQVIYHRYVIDVETIALDGDDRFLIPRRCLKMANIDQQIRFTGMDDSIEIWANGENNKPFISVEEFSKAMEETMGMGGVAPLDTPSQNNDQSIIKESTA